MSELPKLPLIRYNLKDRGRKYRGQERNFNIKAICDAINSPECQEKIKTRAMLGYFGHQPRILAGRLDAVESLVINGRYNEIEPAIVTTHLSASLDGTIEHQTVFLDTASGRKAAAMYSNRIGGFSSAIDEKRPEFAGFDYVLDPNYSSNRPYALDSAGELTLDEVLAEAKTEEEQFLQRLIDVKNAEIEQLKAALDSATVENEQMMGMLMNAGMTLDSVKPPVLPIVLSMDSTAQFQRNIDAFHKEAKLPGFVDVVPNDKRRAEEGYENLLGMMGLKRV